ncbi:helix-turn-helix transcriptional regulator [Prosthecobacter fusiformis]|nr:AraC family transcriptional regulator [Prosthecobacter fusiformis]
MSLLFPAFESRWLGADAQHGGRHWLQAMRPGAVMVVLLLEGSVRVDWSMKSHREIAGNSLIWMNTAVALPESLRLVGGKAHEALALHFPIEWVHQSLTSLRQEMAADFRTLLLGPHPATPLLTRPLEAEDRAWTRSLMAPTLCSAARQLLEGSRMSEFFFRKVLTESKGEELFCTRTRRLSLERVAKVRKALLANLEEPPALEELARLCGCNPQYLSRTFSEAAGTTISLYLRRLRIERAAEMLAAGQANASEAALEVGYRSLSHFSQAFRAEKGISPSAWVRGPQPPANARQLSA